MRTAAGLNINAFLNDFELGNFSGVGTNLYRQHRGVKALQCIYCSLLTGLLLTGFMINGKEGKRGESENVEEES